MSAVEADQQWAKFKLHGISIEQFSGEDGMRRLRKEIETFNPNVRLTVEPRWLTRPETRATKAFSSVVVAVNDAASKKALRKGIYVLGQFRKTDLYFMSRPTDQCGQCLKLGHHWRQCRKGSECCKFCAGGHLSKDHVCTKCGAKGKNCEHEAYRCVNCGKGHMATSPKCEFIVAARGKKATTTEVADNMDDVQTASSQVQQQ